jgi:putative redox protein
MGMEEVSMQPTRTYTNGEITVEWRAELCTHCKNCLSGLPTVFDLNKRPWVNMGGASSDAIKDQVAECPSGALSIKGD